MQVDIQFVNFPKSNQVRQLVQNKIMDCVEKFSSNNLIVKAYFSIDGIEHHVKLSVSSGKVNICVNATSNDIAHSIDKVINKLESSLRKNSKKRIHKRFEFSTVNVNSDYNVINLRINKRFAKNNENIFDKYESHYISNFEDRTRKVS